MAGRVPDRGSSACMGSIKRPLGQKRLKEKLSSRSDHGDDLCTLEVHGMLSPAGVATSCARKKPLNCKPSTIDEFLAGMLAQSVVVNHAKIGGREGGSSSLRQFSFHHRVIDMQTSSDQHEHC